VSKHRGSGRPSGAEVFLLLLCFVALIGLMLLFVSPPIGWTVFGVCALTVLIGSRFVR